MGRAERPGCHLEIMEGYLEDEEKLSGIFRRWHARPKPSQFVESVPPRFRAEDDRKLAELKAGIEREQNVPDNRLSLAMEVCFMEGLHQHDWLGPCDVERSSEADDLIRGVDMVVLFPQGDKEPLCLAVDATCTEHIGKVTEKIGHSLDLLYHQGQLNEVRYLRPDNYPELNPTAHMPRIVLGVKSSEGSAVLKDFMDSQASDPRIRKIANYKLEKGPIAQEVREQAINQLAYQLELALQRYTDDFISSQLTPTGAESQKIRELQTLLQPVVEMDDVATQINTPEWQALIDFLNNPTAREILAQEESGRQSQAGSQPLVDNIYKILDLYRHLKKIKESSPAPVKAGGVGEDDPIKRRLCLRQKDLARVVY